MINSCFSTTPTDPESLAQPDAPAGPRTAAQLGARVQDIEQRTALELDAAERRLGADRAASFAAGHVTPAYDATTGDPLPEGAAPAGPIVPVTEAEAELRELLRLEAIERRTRSIRSAPVVITYRRTDGGPPPAATEAAPVASSGRAGSPDANAPISVAAPNVLETLTALQALDQQTGGPELDAGPMLPAGLERQPSRAGPVVAWAGRRSHRPARRSLDARGRAFPRHSPQGGSGSMKGRL